MSPLPNKKIVQIDPTITELYYGKIPSKYWGMYGKIDSNSYCAQKRTMSYLVIYDDGYETWFLEAELI